MENAIARMLDEIEDKFVSMAIGKSQYSSEQVEALGSLRTALHAYVASRNKWKPSGEGSLIARYAKHK